MKILTKKTTTLPHKILFKNINTLQMFFYCLYLDYNLHRDQRYSHFYAKVTNTNLNYDDILAILAIEKGIIGFDYSKPEDIYIQNEADLANKNSFLQFTNYFKKNN